VRSCRSAQVRYRAAPRPEGEEATASEEARVPGGLNRGSAEPPLLDQLDGDRVVRHEIGDAAIERGQTPSVSDCDREQMCVRDLSVPDHATECGRGWIRRRYVVRPEDVSGKVAHASEMGDGCSGGAGFGNHPRIARDANEPRLGDRARSPAVLPDASEPCDCPRVVNMVGPRESDEDVDVQQASHLSSSAASTISGVIGAAPSPTRKTGNSPS
jgi:hypothetical protein